MNAFHQNALSYRIYYCQLVRTNSWYSSPFGSFTATRRSVTRLHSSMFTCNRENLRCEKNNQICHYNTSMTGPFQCLGYVMVTVSTKLSLTFSSNNLPYHAPSRAKLANQLIHTPFVLWSKDTGNHGGKKKAEANIPIILHNHYWENKVLQLTTRILFL